MATRAEREVERMKHDQDMSEVQRAADAAREQERQRTERERETETAHEAMLEESQRTHLINHGCIDAKAS